MNFLQLTQTRYSTRAYLPKPVEKEKIDYLLECARMAPSAVNAQPWHFIIAQSENARHAIQSAYDRKWFKEAPCYIIVSTDESIAWRRQFDNKSHADIDASIVAEHICLAAASIGLGSCWVCNFDPELLAKSLVLSPTQHPVVIIPIGYPSNTSQNDKIRKDISDLVTYI